MPDSGAVDRNQYGPSLAAAQSERRVAKPYRDRIATGPDRRHDLDWLAGNEPEFEQPAADRRVGLVPQALRVVADLGDDTTTSFLQCGEADWGHGRAGVGGW